MSEEIAAPDHMPETPTAEIATHSSTETESGEKLTDYAIAKKLVQLKQSADSRGIHFDLKFSTVKKLLSAKKCFYTGKPFSGSGLDGRSIDRVNSELGYTDDNVVPCTSHINGKKANLTVEEILLLAEKIKGFISTKEVESKRKMKK